jgi:glucose/arabinose dehydrogenase
LVTNDLKQPVDLKNAGDGSGRLFVVERAGVIRVLRDGLVLGAPFLDIRDRVGSGSSEQGLLGLAFHPDYARNGFFFVNYTDASGNTVIARFRVSADQDIADPGTETRLLQVGQPYANHNGGGMSFGPDGYLYISLGDGGLYGDPEENAQNTNTYLGKLLRVDVDNASALPAAPPDNPFANGGGLDLIWAYGLRNPWRFSFDALTGDLYLADVGQNEYEEVNFLPAGTPGGTNFGWDYFEGFHQYEGQPPAGFVHVQPVAEYRHNNGNCSVSGGVVYRGQVLPAWQGVYLYGDYCSGSIWALVRDASGGWVNNIMYRLGASIAAFGVDEAGEVYLVDLNGAIWKLEHR